MKKFGIIWDEYRFWLHVPIGIAILLLAVYVDWAVSLAFTVLFVLYELNEDIARKDGAYIDIQGAIGGILIAGGIWALVTKI